MDADLRRPWLQRQTAQHRRHRLRIAGAVGGQHGDEAQRRGAGGADRLLQPRRRARHQHRRLVEGQDLAERIVAAHGDDAGGTGDQVLHVGIEHQRSDPIEPEGARGELGLVVGVHERAQDDQRRVRDVGAGLVGAQHPVDQERAVAAAARRDQEEGCV